MTIPGKYYSQQMRRQSWEIKTRSSRLVRSEVPRKFHKYLILIQGKVFYNKYVDNQPLSRVSQASYCLVGWGRRTWSWRECEACLMARLWRVFRFERQPFIFCRSSTVHKDGRNYSENGPMNSNRHTKCHLIKLNCAQYKFFTAPERLGFKDLRRTWGGFQMNSSGHHSQ